MKKKYQKKKRKEKTCSTTRLSQRVYRRDFCSHVFAIPVGYIVVFWRGAHSVRRVKGQESGSLETCFSFFVFALLACFSFSTTKYI